VPIPALSTVRAWRTRFGLCHMLIGDGLREQAQRIIDQEVGQRIIDLLDQSEYHESRRQGSA